jgi:UDP-N-acetylmuramoyl-L-alanyl-D-glutamate--2,6-diaminopimelate ligase
MLKSFLYKVKRIYHFFKTGLLKGFVSEIKYGFPANKIKIIAITGTDGKTTTSTLVYHLLKNLGHKTALISTAGVFTDEANTDLDFHVTTPQPNQIQKTIKDLVDLGYEYLVLESTSQGIYQYRTWGIHPTVAGITNVAQDHFDYHLNYQNYLIAKALILKAADSIILNKDDQSYEPLKEILRTSDSKITTFSKDHTLPSPVKKAIKDKFPQPYNQENARLAYQILKQLKIDLKQLPQSIMTYPGVPGRMEEIETKKQFRVVVDFAHTPQGLTAALTALKQDLKKQTKKGRLIAIYGAAGLRDADKRPEMGRIGVDLADLVIFTAEDPRTEDVWSIIRQLKEGLSDKHNKVLSIADRKQAINYAITELAKPGDIIALLGKGSEQSMCYGTTEHPWDDRQVAREALAK